MLYRAACTQAAIEHDNAADVDPSDRLVPRANR